MSTPKGRNRASASDLKAMFGRAQRLEAAGRHQEALDLGREMVKLQPGWAMGHYAMGSALCAMGLLDEADAALGKAIARDGNNAGFFTRRAEVLNRLGHHQEALATIDRAVALSPGDGRVIVVKAMVLWLGGDKETAYRVTGEALGAGVEHLPLRNVHAQLAGAMGDTAAGIAGLEAILDESDGGKTLDRMLCSEVLMQAARLYDKAGRYDEAFAAAQRGGAMRQTGYDPDEVRERCDDRIEAWSAERIARVPEARFRTDKPVFIIGMPRSGTSLVEQIIASHPLAYGGGEMLETKFAAHELSEPNAYIDSRAAMVEQIKPAPLDRCARKVLRVMEKAAMREKGEGVERITDKLPNNYEYVGIIAKLFPDAKIIHCTRNPLDTCVSLFMLDFVGDRNHGYSYNLEHLAAQYQVYERYMAHWRSVSPIEMLEVCYEDLVANPEAGARGIIEHIGLGWDGACARAHETKRAVSTLSSDQVRRPVYTSSVGRWKHYQKHIGVLVGALGAGG